jgi:hypothetical protein
MGKDVEFLYLSVRDYIASKLLGISSHFERSVNNAFTADLISLLQLLPPDELFKTHSWDGKMNKPASSFSPLMDYTDYDWSEFSGFRPIHEFFLHAWIPANSLGSYQRRLLLELDWVCSRADKHWHGFYLESALKDFYWEMPVVVGWDCWNTDVFCLCLSHGLDTYVREEIEVYGYKVEERTGRPLLHFFFDLCYTQFKMPNLDILRLLLKHGAKPNEVFDEKTSWGFALLAVEHFLMNYRGLPKIWTQPLLVLLEHRAIPNKHTDHSDSDLMIVCNGIDETNWLLDDGTKKLLEALIRGGVNMDEDELKLVGEYCGQQIRTFLEEKIQEMHIWISETDL